MTLEFAEGPVDGVIAVETIGSLALTLGRVFAGDPFAGRMRDEAFERTVTPGVYPVLAAWAEVAGEPRRRCVAAWIQLSGAGAMPRVARWAQALNPGQDPGRLGPGEMFGCTVSAGCACFADPDAAAEEGEGIDEGFDESLQPAPHMVVFTSGWGDGQYPCFWGLDAADIPVALLMDVELINRLNF